MCNGLRCLSGLDRSAGKVIRRYERAEPGDLIHIGHQKSRQNPLLEADGSFTAKLTPYLVEPAGGPRLGYSYSLVAINGSQPLGLRRGTQQRNRYHALRVL